MAEQVVVGYALFGGDDEGRGVLPKAASEMLAALRKRLGEVLKSEPDKRNHILDAAGCLDRLAGCLLQVSRIARPARDLAARPIATLKPPMRPGMTRGEAAPMLCIDFESLLIHARATLDRMTGFVAREHRQHCDSFPELAAVLSNVTKKDERPRLVLGVLKEAPSISGILTDEVRDGRNELSLRSLVTHRKGIREAATHAFTIICSPNGHCLVFDCEALGYPVFETAHLISRSVPFIVLNTIASYIGGIELLPLSSFEPAWPNPAVVYTRYLDPSEKSPIVVVAQLHVGGLTFIKRSLLPTVFDLAR